MKALKIKDIRTDAGTQIRVRLNDDTVKEYAEAFSEGAKFPPVIVFHDGSRYILADGFHRVAGAINAGLKDILADVRQGNVTVALKYALGANANHGLKRTAADKRNAIHVALKEFAKFSNAELAKICAVDDKTVADVRKSMESTSEIPRLEARIGADGKERKLPVPPPPPKKSTPPPEPKVSNIIPLPSPKKTIEKPLSVPAPKPIEPEVITDKTGWPISEKHLPLWNRASEVQELLTSVSRVKSALRRAQDDKDKLFSEVSFSSVLAHLDQAYTDIKTALPFAVCPTCQGRTASSCALCKGRAFISEFKWNTVVPKETKDLRKKAQEKK